MSVISELSSIRSGTTKARTPEEKRRQAKEAGRDNKALVQFHYDLSNAFYALFLYGLRIPLPHLF